MMKKSLFLTCILLVCVTVFANAQSTSIFPKGKKSPNVHHVGNVWLTELNEADSTFTYSTAVAIFDPGARLDWHTHPGGQILIITEGTGYYQERGQARKTVRRGEVVKCQPGVEHWHGATPDQGVTYIATSPSLKGKTIWLDRVTDAEYGVK